MPPLLWKLLIMRSPPANQIAPASFTIQTVGCNMPAPTIAVALHAMPIFTIAVLSLKRFKFNKINMITARDFPALPIDTPRYHCYLVARNQAGLL
jgi:hypothetical protein